MILNHLYALMALGNYPVTVRQGAKARDLLSGTLPQSISLIIQAQAMPVWKAIWISSKASAEEVLSVATFIAALAPAASAS